MASPPFLPTATVGIGILVMVCWIHERVSKTTPSCRLCSCLLLQDGSGTPPLLHSVPKGYGPRWEPPIQSSPSASPAARQGQALCCPRPARALTLHAEQGDLLPAGVKAHLSLSRSCSRTDVCRVTIRHKQDGTGQSFRKVLGRSEHRKYALLTPL